MSARDEILNRIRTANGPTPAAVPIPATTPPPARTPPAHPNCWTCSPTACTTTGPPCTGAP
ncbi:hypothetical protein ACFQZ4_06295 [Catellatospora coxensis]